jgi:hypothetical protein
VQFSNFSSTTILPFLPFLIIVEFLNPAQM